MYYDALGWYVPLLLVVASWVLLFHKGDRQGQQFVLVILAFLSLMVYTDWFGKRHSIPNVDGHHKPTSLHLHDWTHYYFGAKYFPELGYQGLYDGLVAADRELGGKMLFRRKQWHDLGNKLHTITEEDSLARFNAEIRPAFIPERWEAFLSDVGMLEHLLKHKLAARIIMDHGFNPTPVWLLFGHGLVGDVSLSSEGQALRLGETYLVELTPYLDYALQVFSLIAIGVFISWRAAIVFVLLYGVNPAAGVDWISGSYLRFVWFFALIVGVGLLYRAEFGSREHGDKKGVRGEYGKAGGFLALSALSRVFPSLFAIGAAIPVLWRGIERKEWRDFRHYTLGGVATSLVLILLSAMLLGWSAWGGFIDNIRSHGGMFAINHFGLSSLATYDLHVPDKDFGGDMGMENFRDWNERRAALWDERKLLLLPLALLAMGWVAWLMRRRSSIEAGAVFTTFALFLFLNSSNYYWLFLPLIGVVYAVQMDRDPLDLRARFMLGSVLLFWLLGNIWRYYEPSFVPQFAGMNILICGWLLAMMAILTRFRHE